MRKILELLEKDASLTYEQIANILNLEPEVVKQQILEYEKKHVIAGYKTVINWELTDKEPVYAMIELCVSPTKGGGFDEVAQRIGCYDEVASLYLMSGAYDLLIVIEGRTMKEVALFVAEKLAPMEEVNSTSTSFLLKKYKVDGIDIHGDTRDMREVITL